MKARPLLFSSPMVRALLAGAKSQTRRVIEPQPFNPACPGVSPVWGCGHHAKDSVFRMHAAFSVDGKRVDRDVPCPFGSKDDLLWVREAWRVGKPHNNTRPSEILAPLVKRGKGVTALYEAGGWRSVGPPGRDEPVYPDDEPMPSWAGKARASIHMPRWASRITLRINDVRVERLQDITSDDCIAEGIDPSDVGDAREEAAFNRDAYAELWESINGKGSWAANSWVWVIAFDVIKANVDKVLAEAA